MTTIKKNLTGKIFGCAAESFGISVSSSKQKASSDVYRHKDNEGHEDGFAFYNFKQALTLTGTVTADAALSLAIGSSISSANETAGLGGVTGGTTLIMTVELGRTNEGAAEITLECERSANLTVGE